MGGAGGRARSLQTVAGWISNKVASGCILTKSVRGLRECGSKESACATEKEIEYWV